jgi:peptidoglycan/xylan/chitin deacetylase (PgdA/CDA1 family)
MYHDVVSHGAFDSSGFLFPGADRYKLDSREFERHLAAIACEVGLTPTTLTGPMKSGTQRLLLTFDDGGVSCHSPIADMLERYDWRGHFFVTTDFINTPRFLSRVQVRELRARGHVVGTHSCSHPQISRCSPSQMKKEWSDSVEKLEDILGEPVTVASVPGGFYSRRVAEEAFAAGVCTMFTSEPTTKFRKIKDLVILGRYSIRRDMSYRVAAGLARGDSLLCFGQLVHWKAKGIVKALGGRHYAKLRDMLLSRASGTSDIP